VVERWMGETCVAPRLLVFRCLDGVREHGASVITKKMGEGKPYLESRGLGCFKIRYAMSLDINEWWLVYVQPEPTQLWMINLKVQIRIQGKEVKDFPKHPKREE
jgi:hypothetical protein